jgi:DNA-binding YbaB/EbfC family protein
LSLKPPCADELDQVETKTQHTRFRREGAYDVQPGQTPDMSALLAQAQQVQQQLMEAQESLANAEVHGQAGGGLVLVTVKGSGDIVAVAIDPKVVDPDDVETLQDLIVGALLDAARQVAILAQSRLGPLASGLGNLGLPGI